MKGLSKIISSLAKEKGYKESIKLVKLLFTIPDLLYITFFYTSLVSLLSDEGCLINLLS